MVAVRVLLASEVVSALRAAPLACCDQVLTDLVMRAAINQALATVSFDGTTSYALSEIQSILEIGSAATAARILWFWSLS